MSNRKAQPQLANRVRVEMMLRKWRIDKQQAAAQHEIAEDFVA